MPRITLIGLVLTAILCPAVSLQCYSCKGETGTDNCSLLGAAIPRETGCSECMTVSKSEGKLYSHTRSCVTTDRCISTRESRMDTTVLTRCCSTEDLCNKIVNNKIDPTTNLDGNSNDGNNNNGDGGDTDNGGSDGGDTDNGGDGNSGGGDVKSNSCRMTGLFSLLLICTVVFPRLL